MTASQIGGAGAYARTAMLASAIPVRPIDPTRQRFQVKSEVEAQQAKDQSAAVQTDQADEQFATSTDQASSGGSRGGFGLLGAFTSFLARMFAQPETEAAAATSMQTGIQAYSRSAGSVPVNENGGIEVMSPSYPRLASGRAIDLTV